MKNLFLFTIILLNSFRLFASDSTIVFRNLPYGEMIRTAQEDKKLIFLYFHFNGCGACVKMEKTTFKDPQVADFMNQHFVNLTINTLEGEGIETNKIFNVKIHPTFMIMDEKENILHKWVGVFTPDEFISHAKGALNGKRRYADYVEEYKKGNRDPEFLYQYSYLMRDAYELPASVIEQYISTQTGEALYEEKNIKFVYEFAMHNFEIAIPFNSEPYRFMLDHRDLFGTFFNKDQVDSRLIWIADHTAEVAIEALNDTLYKQAFHVVQQFPTGKMYEFHEMDGRTTGIIMEKNLPLTLQMAYERKQGNMADYRKTSKQYLDQIWDDPSALNERAWSIYIEEEDPQWLESAISSVRRSIKLKRGYANSDTYAALLYKTGDYKEAYKQAIKAIELAKIEVADFTDTSALLDKINEQLKNK